MIRSSLAAALTLGFGLALVAPLAAQERQNAPRFENVNVERDVQYGAAGDRALLLDVYRPAKPSGKRLPAVVFIHGGGWQGGNKSSGSVVAPFAASGNYVGFSIGYRLSGEAIWPAQIHDCKAAIRWIRANAEKYGVDPDRIGVWGSSAGGHLVSLLGTSGDVAELEGNNGSAGVSSRVTCVVDYCGPADFPTFDHPAATRLFGGSREGKEAELKIASPLTHVSKDDPPFLVVHGTKDTTVPISQAEKFAAALDKAGVDVTLIRIQNGGHSIRGPEISERVSQFFEKHLRNQNVQVSSEPIVMPPMQN